MNRLTGRMSLFNIVLVATLACAAGCGGDAPSAPRHDPPSELAPPQTIPMEPWSPGMTSVQTADLFKVLPCDCDLLYVDNVAGAFGLAGETVEDEDTFQVLDNGRVLTVYKQSGEFDFLDTVNVDDPEYATGMSADEANAFATAFLSEHDLLPVEATFEEVRPAGPKGTDPEHPQTWDVVFGFGLDRLDSDDDSTQTSVMGASIIVSVGAGEIVGTQWHWRELVRDRNVELRDTPKLVSATHTRKLVYKLEAPGDAQSYVVPYYVETHGHHGGLALASDAIPAVQIEVGEVQADSAILFNATVTGGKPPFTYAWMTTTDPSVLSTNPSMTLLPSPASHLRVAVTDATGLSTMAQAPVPFDEPGVMPNPPTPLIGGLPGPVSAGAKLITGKGWSMTADTGSTDGLVLTNLRFNQQLFASRISMPSYRLATESVTTEQTCKLAASSFSVATCASSLVMDVTCWGNGASINGKPCLARDDPSNPISASGWIENPYRAFDVNSLVVQARYAVDNVTPAEDACTLSVAQTYLFSPLAPNCADSPVPGDEAVLCARFYPLLTYWLADINGNWCDGQSSPSHSWIDAFEAQYRFDFDMAPNAKDFARYVNTSSVGSIFAAMQKTEESVMLVDFGGLNAPLASRGAADDLHVKDSSDGGIVVPTCDAGEKKIMCAHMHWRWPEWPSALGLFGLKAPSTFRAEQSWAPGSQRVFANVVLYEQFSYSSTDPFALVDGDAITTGKGSIFSPLKALDVEVWVITRSERFGLVQGQWVARGKNLWGSDHSGLGDQINSNEWFFQ